MTGAGIATLVKQAVDIVDVIGRAVHLRRAGNRHVGLCPFHHEKTPSFQVDGEHQLYYCFGCGTGGDVISFVSKHQNLTFADAVKYLADRYNISLPQKEQTADGDLLQASREERRRILAAVDCAAEFFYAQLRFSPEGKIAREYVERRGLPAEVVESQRLGYAPQRWDGLFEHLKGSGIEPSLAAKAGLLSQSSSDSSRFFDRFRNRLIFPIRDERDIIVAFGGRTLSRGEQNEPKYLNSSETPVYHKGRMLYQYSGARQACREHRQALLVEGYMDLLAFHAKGFYRVAATLGTALTSQQVRLLSKMCDEVVLAYDGDDAGQKAMLRALPLFLEEELSVSLIQFPDRMDPDDFLKKFGLTELENLVEQREELGAYAVRKAVSAWDGSSAGRAQIFSDLKPIFQKVRQPVLKSEYLHIIANRFSVTEEVAEAQLFHEKRGARTEPAHKPFTSVNYSRPPQIDSLEEKVLRLMIKHPALIECVRESDALGCFEVSGFCAMAEALCRASLGSGEEGASFSAYDLLREPELQELYTRYLLEPFELDEPEIQLRDWLRGLNKRMAKKRRKELQESLHEAERNGDQAQIRNLQLEIRDLTAKRNVCDSSDIVRS